MSCPDCHRPVSADEETAYDEAICTQLDSGGAYLFSDCAKFTIKYLRAALAERDRRLEEQTDALMSAFRRREERHEQALAERDRRIAELQGERDRFRLQVEQ